MRREVPERGLRKGQLQREPEPNPPLVAVKSEKGYAFRKGPEETEEKLERRKVMVMGWFVLFK